jgi:hypothetical protein
MCKTEVAHCINITFCAAYASDHIRFQRPTAKVVNVETLTVAQF